MPRLCRGSKVLRWGLVLVGLACALPASAEAQFRPNRPRRDLPGGRPSRDDPTDPKKQEEATRKKAAEYLQKGQAFLAKGQINRAATQFKAVIELVGTQGVGNAALGQLQGIHRRGMDEIKKALGLYQEGKYREALELAKQCKVLYANLFGGMTVPIDAPDVPRLADQLIQKIAHDPTAQRVIQEFEAARRARKIPRLEKRAKADPTRYLDLYKALKSIAKRYPDCETGARCKAQAAKLSKDGPIWRHITHEKERRFIASALQKIDQYQKAGLAEEAAAEIKKLRDLYSGKSLAALQEMAEK